MSAQVRHIYDTIGDGYSRSRRADHRLAAAIRGALGSASTVVNVGAGTGSYEPVDRAVVAVEPSPTMTAQRPGGSAPVVHASATLLPFADGAFAAALAVLTAHHWPDRERGLTELARVSRDGVVVVTWDPESRGFWLVQDYIPEVLEIDRQIFPPMDEFRRALGPIRVGVLPIPYDCTDGFLGAFWRRPHAYLDAEVRRGMSTFARLRGVDAGLEQLRDDLAAGRWARRNSDLLGKSELDIGYRLVLSGKLAMA